MATLSITLPEPMQAYVEAKIAAGGYPSASEYVQALIRSDFLVSRRTEIDAKLIEALDSYERGEGREMPPNYAEELHARFLERHKRRNGA